MNKLYDDDDRSSEFLFSALNKEITDIKKLATFYDSYNFIPRFK